MATIYICALEHNNQVSIYKLELKLVVFLFFMSV